MRVTPSDAGLRIEVSDEAETEWLGLALAEVVAPGTVIGLVGPLGAGKTRLVRAIAEALGTDPGAIASPTFVLIHEYEARLPVFHFDAYRLRSADEFDALGAADYFEAGGLCLVEWADRVGDRLPADAWWIHIESDPDDSRRRTIRLSLPDPTARRLVARLAGFDDASGRA
jgi:tRNA threonylcarbamoyladenosine biosynthesis protein TsaE